MISKVYGAALPTLTASYSGFVNGDTTNVVSGNPSIGTTASPSSGVGTYSITPVLGTLTATELYLQFRQGQLYCHQSGLTVTANNASKNFGDPYPASLPATLASSIATMQVSCPRIRLQHHAVATSPEGNTPSMSPSHVEFPQLQFFVRQRSIFDNLSPACAFLG